MATVDQLLNVKGKTVHTIGRSNTVFEAIAKMEANNIGALVVMDSRTPVGMITERDYLRRIALKGRSSKTTFVQEIMSPGLIFVDPDTDVEECMSLMTHRRIRHLPVLEAGYLVGLVSIGDVVRHLAKERATTIAELTDYIQGRYA